MRRGRLSRRAFLGLTVWIIVWLFALPVWVLAQGPADGPLNVAENPVLFAIVVGFVMSPVIDAIARRSWSSEVKAVFAFLWCAVVAAAQVYVLGQLDRADWLRTFLIIFVAAIAFHRFYWKPSGISDAIDRATG